MDIKQNLGNKFRIVTVITIALDEKSPSATERERMDGKKKKEGVGGRSPLYC